MLISAQAGSGSWQALTSSKCFLYNANVNRIRDGSLLAMGSWRLAAIVCLLTVLVAAQVPRTQSAEEKTAKHFAVSYTHLDVYKRQTQLSFPEQPPKPRSPTR